MSRIGLAPIPIPQGVEIAIEPRLVTVKGPRGELRQEVAPGISVEMTDGKINVSRPSDSREHRALHGLTRSLVANMVTGVTEGFQKTLQLVGVGYRVQQSGESIVLQVGFSHPVTVHPLPGTTLVVEGNNRILVQGPDKQSVGEIAAQIRRVRKPNVYTGKGVRYAEEQVRLKPGKSAGRTG